jgi:hypothetical protein
MEKRRHKRIIDNLDAEITAGDITYAGIIMNLSEDGCYMVTATSNKDVELGNHLKLKLKCKLPSGKALNMNCEVKWFQTKTSPYGTSFSMGMEIINPPLKYKEFIRSL